MTVLAKLALTLLLLLGVFACNRIRSVSNKKLLYGHWQTTKPETNPNIILDDKTSFILILGDDGESDSLEFNYSLKGKILTIYQGNHWFSKNIVIKLTSDSLEYKRRGDWEVFKYSRKME